MSLRMNEADEFESLCVYCTYADSLSVDHQVNVFVDFAIFVIRLWALASRVVGLDVRAVTAV